MRKRLALFAEIAKGFIDSDRLKLILFASGVKPSTFVALKINSVNLGDKYRFEQRLSDAVFVESRPHSFEEITDVKKNNIIWQFKGVWIGYDLFQDKKGLNLFKQYVTSIRKHNDKKADAIGGKLYDYPACCVKDFVKERNAKYIKKNFSYYKYHKRDYDCVRKFPFIFHTPCSNKCKESSKLNTKYKRAVKKTAPKFYKEFSRKKVLKTDLIVDAETDIFDEKNKTIWPVKDGHNYSVVAKTPFQGKHYLYTHLTKKCYSRGTILDAKVTMRYNYADIKVKKAKGVVKNLRHTRKFKVLGRKF